MKEFLHKYKKTILFFIYEVIFLLFIDFFNQYLIIRSLNIFDYIVKTIWGFDFVWIGIFLIILYILNPKIRKVVILIFNPILSILSIVNFFMYSYFHSIFSFKDLFLTGDGFSFINSIFNFIDLKLILFICLCLFFTILVFKTKTKKTYCFKSVQSIILIVFLILFLGIRYLLIDKLSVTNDGWDSTSVLSNNANYYTNWIEPTKIVRICGIYEYFIKDFYHSFIEKDNVIEAKNKASEYIKNKIKVSDSEYNGLFKNKNLIFVMMESMDDWMINESVTPTIYEMMQHGFNFTNHYSPGYITGDTANTEFIANTGMYPNINKLSPNYAYVNNSYPYSIANLFKDNDYTVNSFHRSFGFIYNRSEMHLSLGYEKYYSYVDMGISDDNLDLDNYIISDGYQYIISSDKFMSFIITYSPHDPYSYDKIECKNNLEDIKNIYPDTSNEELLCSYSAARETDNMFKLLLENLKKDGLIDDTVIVAFSDHRNKDISPNGEDEKLNKTAFFIYDASMENNQISTITSSINILPTILNLFGIENDYVYPGYDALNYNGGYVIFKDYTYYDGEIIKPIGEKEKEQLEYSSSLLKSDYYSES